MLYMSLTCVLIIIPNGSTVFKPIDIIHFNEGNGAFDLETLLLSVFRAQRSFQRVRGTSSG